MLKYLNLNGKKSFQKGREESLERPCSGNSEKRNTFFVKKTIYTYIQFTIRSEIAN